MRDGRNELRLSNGQDSDEKIIEIVFVPWPFGCGHFQHSTSEGPNVRGKVDGLLPYNLRSHVRNASFERGNSVLLLVRVVRGNEFDGFFFQLTATEVAQFDDAAGIHQEVRPFYVSVDDILRVEIF